MSLSNKVILCAILTYLLGVDADIKFRHHGPPPLPTNHTLRKSEWHTITQKVDNFNNADNRTWEMRYISMADYYKPGGPMFIYLGGEWVISEGYLEGGLIADIGKQHNAYMFYTEHRYYGESQPVPDWSAENMRYLSVDQALADVAYFIEHIKSTQIDFPKVIVYGASYSAEMATWMRLKYPHLIDAAWASSAPLVAQVDYPEYYEVVGDSIREVSEECYNLVASASRIMYDLLRNEAGRQELSQHFYTCTPLRGDFPYDQHFWNTYTEVFASQVQYAWPGNIQAMCEKMLASEGGNDMEKMGTFVRNYYNGGCLGDYDEFLEYYGTAQITNGIYRQWYYQVCTEFAYLQTTTSPNQPFVQDAVTPLYFERICQDLFGSDAAVTLAAMQSSVERTNRVYGGRNRALTKVVSIHGSVDPWHTPGITKSLHELAPARLVRGSAHCQDSGAIVPSDSAEMQEAKRLVLDSIAKWIA